MVLSAGVGKMPSDMHDRFCRDRCVNFFALNETSKTANVCVHFSPKFSVVEGISRIILSPSAIGVRML